VSGPDRGAIAEKHALDVRVYDAARELFWQKWRAAGADATRALERVRRAGRAPRWRAWQDDRLRRARQAARRLVQRSRVR
jgi:hypothetical protein